MKTRFRVDPALEDWATNYVKQMGDNFKLEGAILLGCENDVRIWFRDLTNDKLDCKLLQLTALN